MCHKDSIVFFGETRASRQLSADIDCLVYDTEAAGKRIAVLPDIYGLTDFYKGYASYLSGFGATVYLTNPWSEFGELPEPTREAAYARRHLLRDKTHCDRLQAFLASEKIDAIVGFCLGGNFAFEMARRKYGGDVICIYPLPWGMANQDEITPAFEYMPTLAKDVTVFMGAADHLAGPDNIGKLVGIADTNPQLTLHLYGGSNHGFFTDVDGDDKKLAGNAQDAIEKVSEILF